MQFMFERNNGRLDPALGNCIRRMTEMRLLAKLNPDDGVQDQPKRHENGRDK